MFLGSLHLFTVTLLLLATGSNLTNAANILAIFPFQARSHMILGSALVDELLKRGHHVTLISHFPQNEHVANLTDVYVKTTMADVDAKAGSPDTLFERQDEGILDKIKTVYNFIFNINQATCDLQLHEESVQKLIHATDLHFDAVVVEAFFNECYLGFVQKFKAPLIQVCTFAGMQLMFDWMGNPYTYSYLPDQFLPFSDKMSFKERMINTILGTAAISIRNLFYVPVQDAVMRKHFGFLEDLPSLYDIEHSTSLLLLNTHFSISFPRPLLPNVVHVGGMHVKPSEKLPQDLQTFLDDAPNGVIYFSLGSNLRSTCMPEATRNALLKAFSQLKQKILWKWETDTLPGQPKNVKLGKWFPQSDILAHPNVHVFMTHGGLLGIQEALYRGVPLVGIPVFGDQEVNMLRAEKAGYGVLLALKNVTAESVKWSLEEVLNNPRYRENAQRLSKIYRDQPLTPLEQAVFWTEYVIRHKGAPHMRSGALNLSWYQYHLLDVIAVIAFAIIFLLSLTVIVPKSIFRKCYQKKQVDKTKKQN